MQRDSRRGTMMIKSNPIPAGWVAHKLENNNTKVVLLLLWKFWAPSQASQTGDPEKWLGIPRESDFEGQWDLITGLPQDWENKRLHSWRAQTKSCAHQDRGKEQPLDRRLNQNYLLVLEGSCGGVGQPGLTTGMGALAAAVLESPHWPKPSWRSPLTLS